MPAGLLGLLAGGRVRNEIWFPTVVPAGLLGMLAGGRVRNEIWFPAVVPAGLLGLPAGGRVKGIKNHFFCCLYPAPINWILETA